MAGDKIRKEAAFRLLRNGATQRQLRAELGLTPGQAAGLVRRFREANPTGDRTKAKAAWREILRLAMDGRRPGDIGARLKIASSEVGRVIAAGPASAAEAAELCPGWVRRENAMRYVKTALNSDEMDAAGEARRAQSGARRPPEATAACMGAAVASLARERFSHSMVRP